jgi:LacI family transcriptional regulator
VSARRTTRDDVARLAKTSTAVVSYVVNDGPRNVSPELRARVVAAMDSLGYYPNAIARSLAATQSRTLGMIVPNINNSYFAELALAVEEAALGRDRLLFLGNSNETEEREQAYIRTFIEQRVDGIIIIGVALESSIERAALSGVPVVVVDRALAKSDARTVSIDHRAAAYSATMHLIDHGHREIACLTGPENQLVAEDRRQGWSDALRTAGIDPDAQRVVRSSFSLEGGAAALEQHGQLPRALFVASDEQARGVIAAAARRGVSVPGDLALVSVDGTREGEFSNPALTTMRQPYSALADAAVAAVLGLTGPEKHVVVPTELSIRQSCGCP